MFVAIGLLPLPPINIAYTVEFRGNVPDGTKIAFSFDRDSNTPKASTQYTAVTSGSAHINLDPANGQSQTLSMILQQQNISIQQFSSSISIPKDHINITLTCISGNTIHAQAAGEATSFTLSQQQLKGVHSAAAFQSEVKVFLLIFLGFVYLIYLARISLLRGISRPYFGVIIACVIIAVGLATYIATQSTSRLRYRVFAIALLLLLLPVLAVNYLIGKRCGTVARKSLIIVDYSGVLAYMTVQFHLFTTQLGGFPDEIAHLSYIAYMKLHGGWVPDFSAMRIYPETSSNVLNLSDNSSNSFNYLGHPPLYYKLMSLFSGMGVQGNTVTFDLNHMRMISFIIGIIGMVLVFYITFTRIPDIPLLHVLVGLIAIAPANMVYTMSGLNNDTLLLVTVTLFTLGVIRFMESRNDLLTYALITMGMCSTALTKLTGGMMVASMAVLVVAYTIWTERGPKRFLRKSLYSTLPMFLFPLVYFLTVLSRWHTIQPSYQRLAPSEFISSQWYVAVGDRTQLTLIEYTTYFFRRFLECWSSIVGHVPVARPGTTPFTADAIGVTLILLIPLCIFFFNRTKQQRFLAMGITSILLAVLYQFFGAAAATYGRGNLGGGVQSRYYQCAIAVLVLTIVWMLDRHPFVENRSGSTLVTNQENRPSQTRQLTSLGVLAISCFSALLLYDGFISAFLLSGR